jgi:hypothetical protein
MPKLIEVEQDLVNLLDSIMEIEHAGGEVPPASLALLDQYAMAATDKRDACADFLEFVETQENACKDQVVAIIERHSAIARARERFESYLLSVMERNGVIAAMGNRSKFVVMSSESVDVQDASQVPPEYMRVKPAPAPEPDKAAIKVALKKGESVGGARLVSKTRIVVKALAVKDRPGDTLLGLKP